jgi:hypothetical protein
LQTFVQGQATINNQTSQDFDDIRSTLTKLSSFFSIQEKCKFLAQPEQNPQGHFLLSGSNSSEGKPEHIKSITTLRSGRIIDKTISPTTQEPEEFSKPKSDDKLDKYEASEAVKCPITAPFPQRLQPWKKLSQNFENFEILKQVKINIPLLDAIKQIPSYAKFLKDSCTVKHKLHVQKRAFLCEQVSAILRHKTPSKYKDPGFPTISCVIGDFRIEQALFDLGASVNLLPFSVYEQLGLDELKPTSITLQLVDRSMRIPRRVVEDVLVQIHKFYFPVDFIVLDTNLISNVDIQISIILGHHFLATSNALIKCRSDVMKLSFGNMTLEVNIFNICHQPRDDEEIHEVNLIETLVLDQFNVSCFSDPLEACLDVILVIMRTLKLHIFIPC